MRKRMLMGGLFAVLLLSGCGTIRNNWVRFKSGMVMLDTHIVLYSADGDTIQTWHTRAKVETDGGEAWWVADDGTQHHISGTFTVIGR